MSIRILAFVTSYFEQIWRIFTGWVIPGTVHITPAVWFMFVLSLGVVLRFLIKLGFGSPSLNDLSQRANDLHDSERSGTGLMVK